MTAGSREEILRHLNEAIGACERSGAHLNECFLAYKQSKGWFGQGYKEQEECLSKAATYLVYAIEEISKVKGM